MKVLAIVASPKKDGNVSAICGKILEGAAQNQHQIELVNLYDYNLKYCNGCLTCAKTRRCSIDDDFSILFNKEMGADIIIYGTPIYCHDVPGILKTFMDRHVHAVIPHVEIKDAGGFFGKTKLAMDYLKNFKLNKPFMNKKFIMVVTCSNPSKGDKQMKQVLYVLKSFIQDEMKAEIVKKIIYTDTLFRFKEKRFEQKLKLAYRIGSALN